MKQVVRQCAWAALALLGLGLLIWPAAGMDLSGQWQEVGAGSAAGPGISQTSGNSDRPDLAVAPDGSLLVAWSDDSGGDAEIYVRRWRDGVWEEVGGGSASGGGVSDNSGPSERPSLAAATDGTIYVAWEDGSAGNKEIYLRRFSGGVWSPVGGSAAGGGISATAGDSVAVALALGPEESPYVVWSQATATDTEIYLRRWNANAWVEVGGGSAAGGGVSNNAGDSSHPALAVGAAGEVLVSWADNSGGDTELFARRYQGATWTEMGAGSAGGGGISDNGGRSRDGDVALAGDGTPFLVWSDDSSGNFEIYARRWDGAAWQEVGAGSAAGGGVSQTAAHSHAPRVIVDGAGRPVVAWYQVTGADTEIYLRRWNGATWEELGGSGSGGGLSNNASASAYPAAGVLDGRIVVAWSDNGGGQYEIYARHWVEEAAPTATATATATATPSPTASATATATSTAGPTATATASSTATATQPPTGTPTATRTPTRAPTATPTATRKPPTATPTRTPTATATTPVVLPDHFLPLVVFGFTPTPIPTTTATATATATPTTTPTLPSTPTATATATVPPIDELQNGDFELGRNGAWLEYSAVGLEPITTEHPQGLSPHSGVWLTWLGGAYNETAAIMQRVTVPSNRPYLRYWHWLASADACGYDVGGVMLGEGEENIVDAFWLCRTNNTGGWRARVLDLRAWAGQAVELTFLVGTDGSLNSNWFVDDVVFLSPTQRAQLAAPDTQAADALGALQPQLRKVFGPDN